MKTFYLIFYVMGLLLFFTSCGSQDSENAEKNNDLSTEKQIDSQDTYRKFLANLRELCGNSYLGEPIYPLDDPEHPFYNQPILVSFSVCEENRVFMPLQVGENTSRTWQLSLSDDGLLLKHDHRHEDGTHEELSMYGGWATEEGTEWSQFFPADEETAEMLPEASTNVWNMVIHPDEGIFEYILHRHGNLRFHAVINIAEPVE
jgi:hypothetical protein